MKNYTDNPLFFDDGDIIAVRGDVAERSAKRLIKATWMEGDWSYSQEYDTSLHKPLKRGYCYRNGAEAKAGREWAMVCDHAKPVPEGVAEPLAVWYFED